MANGVPEHRVNMPVAPALVALPAENRLNRFVHVVASVERVGNALGTLAFTWATVVLLGGYPTVLRLDFWFSTAIIFLEALRMYSGNNRLDYQLFFRTRGAFRSLGSNGLIVFACFSNIYVLMIIQNSNASTRLSPLFVALFWIGLFLFPYARKLVCSPLRQAMSLWSPMVAILLLYHPILYSFDESLKAHKLGFKNSIAKQAIYMVLFVAVLLLTISRLQFPSIIKVVDRSLGSKIVFWRQVILNLSMFATIGMLVSTFYGYMKIVILSVDITFLMIVSLGNLQIPAAVLRIVLAVWGSLEAHDRYSDHEHADKANLGEKTNLVSSLYIFYAMVFGQGIFYIIASICDIFSFILRKSLLHHAGFRGPLGAECVNLYYEDAFQKCMKGAVLAPKKISLITFAMDSLKSDSPKKQLYGIKMLYNFLKKDPLKTKAISELTTCMKAMTFLINMLGWTSEGDKYIRSLAAMVTAEVAANLRIVLIPGAMQAITSLLDTVEVRKTMDPFFDIGSPEPKRDKLIQHVSGNKQTSPMLNWLKQMAIYCLIPRKEPSNMDEQKCLSVPEEETSTDQDLLPVHGMLILDKLASFDLDNCLEISRSTGPISKIIEFTSNRTNMKNINEIHKTILKGSSLKLLRTLSSTRGKSGVILRQKISEHPFLLIHIADILDDTGSSPELREVTTELLRNLAMERNMKEEIGHIPMIISRLMHAFLSQGAPSASDSDQLLRLISGQALAVLAMECANNCSAMLMEPGYEIIKQLAVMIHGERYRYIASSLLQNMCMHARPQLGTSDLKDISYILREVLEGILDAEGAELEVLVGLSSQICNAIPDDFVRELEHGQVKERFIKTLVHALNSNMIPTAHCPGIRRVIVEHAIYMLQCDPGYAKYFKKYWMMETLIRVGRTPSRAENCKFFLGDAGLMDHSIPLSALVSRAKQLMSRE